MLRVLEVVLGGNSIVTPRRFLRQREVALAYLRGIPSDALGRAMTGMCLIVLLASRLLVRWPACIEATARPLIGS